MAVTTEHRGGVTTIILDRVERRNAIDVGIAVKVEEEAALGMVDDQRTFLGVDLHRREGMPDMSAVPLLQLIARRVRTHGKWE